MGQIVWSPTWRGRQRNVGGEGGQDHIKAVGVEAIARAEVEAPSVRVGRARRIAEGALRGSLEANGTPVILHVRRVAKSSPDFARSVAWLHDVLEDSSVSEEELLASGLTDEELRALRLLTRGGDSRSAKHYLSHISHIARSSGFGRRDRPRRQAPGSCRPAAASEPAPRRMASALSGRTRALGEGSV